MMQGSSTGTDKEISRTAYSIHKTCSQCLSVAVMLWGQTTKCTRQPGRTSFENADHRISFGGVLLLQEYLLQNLKVDQVLNATSHGISLVHRQ